MQSQIDLSTFAGGAVAERFNIELQRVIENIADPNTDPKKARTLILKLTIKADENRDVASVDIETKAGLVPAKPVVTKIVIDQDSDGNVVAAELKSGIKDQMMIDDDGDVADHTGRKIVQFKP